MITIILFMFTLLRGVASACDRSETSLLCREEWDGQEVDSAVEEVKIFQWNGLCHFPAGVKLQLFGPEELSCATCPHFEDDATVNCKICTTVHTEGKTAPEYDTARTTQPNRKTVGPSVAGTTSGPRRKSVDPGVAGLLLSDIPSWTLALIIGLATTTVSLSVAMVIVIRFRRNRLYCCKHRTSNPPSRSPSLISTESLELYPRSRNPV